MQHIIKLKLAAVHHLCNEDDKSTEFMIEFMQKICEVDLDCVMSYLQLDSEEHQKLFKEVDSFTKVFSNIEDFGYYK